MSRYKNSQQLEVRTRQSVTRALDVTFNGKHRHLLLVNILEALTYKHWVTHYPTKTNKFNILLCL